MQHELSKEAKALLVSFGIYAVMLPLITTFTNAFIWHERQDLGGLLLFYFPAYIMVVVLFIVNGWFLKKVLIGRLYALGLVSLALGVMIMVYLGKTDDLSLILLGSLWGLTIGLYWSNRNILTQLTTNDQNRNYFTGIESSSQNIIAMIVPIVMGYFIELIGRSAGIDYTSSYKVLVWIVLAASLLGAFYILKAKFTDYTPKRVIFWKATPRWNRIRLVNFLMGITSGVIMIFPSFLVLSMVGKEGSLGVMDSLGAMAGAVIIYVLGRKITAEKRQRILQASLILEMLGALLFFLIWGYLGAAIYVLLTGIRAKMLWLGINPLVMKYIDKEALDKDIYAYSVDREVFLNIGRLVAIVLMMVLNNGDLVIKTTPLMMIVSVGLISWVESRLRNGRLENS